jgi:hypothetical protein
MGFELRVFFKLESEESDLNAVSIVKALWKENSRSASGAEMPLHRDLQRIDTYIDFKEPSVGLKLRHGSKLELKLRRDSSPSEPASSPIASSSDSKESFVSDAVAEIPLVEHWTKQHPAWISAPLTALKVADAYFPSKSKHVGSLNVREQLLKYAQQPNGDKTDIFDSGVFQTVEIAKKRVQMNVPFKWCSKVHKGRATIEQTDLEVKLSKSSASSSSSSSSQAEPAQAQKWRTIAIEGDSEAALRAMWMFLFPKESSYAHVLGGGYPEFVKHILCVQ